MSKKKDALSKRVIRISIVLVILFAVTAVAMTVNFVLTYSSILDTRPNDSPQTVTSLDKKLFDDITETHAQKTADRSDVSADIRNPFSPLSVPMAPGTPGSDAKPGAPEPSLK